MNVWNQFPFIRLLIALLLGIVAALFIDIPVKNLTIVLAIIFVLLSIVIIKYKQIIIEYRFRWIAGVLIFSIFFFIGYEFSIRSNSKYNSDFFGRYLVEKSTIIAQLSEPILEKENSNRAILKVLYLKNEGQFIPVSGKIISYFEKDSLSSALNYGDLIVFSAKVVELQEPKNPAQFNYKKYLSNKGIYHQTYCRKEFWRPLALNHGNIIRKWALNARSFFLEIFKKNNVDGQQYAVVSALILGYTDKIDPELIKSYSNVGAMHILSVSGLHVGVVFLIINYLLFFTKKLKNGKLIKALVSIILIWFYAAITGFSPSVLRAATMISFVIVGNALDRYTSIYNSIAFSAFLLLLINPYNITDVGFQLSYIALVGIVAFQKPFSSIWTPKNWILKNLRDLIMVPIAAQIATFPLGLMYFKQFSNYFILTNIFAIPLSTLVIYGGIIVFIISPIGLLASYFSILLVWNIKALNFVVEFIDKIPFSLSENIHVNVMQMILLYALILFISFFISKKQVKYLYASMIAVIFIFGLNNFRIFKIKNSRVFIVYHVNKHTAINFIFDQKHYFYADSNLCTNKAFEMNIQPNWLACDLKSPKIISKNTNIHSEVFYKNNYFFQFYQYRFALINPENYNVSSTYKIPIDFLIISGNPKCSISSILENYEIRKTIIFDASNSTYNINKWIGECKKSNVNYFNTQFSGAFIYNI